MDMNKGYHGYSMSKRAASAYINGEKPLSRWTKKTIIDAISEWEESNNRLMTVDVNKMTRDDLIESYIRYSSWHHTSKMINVTEFYQLSDMLLTADSREMTAEEIKSRDDMISSQIKAEEEAEKRIREDLENAREVEKAFEEANGYSKTCWWRLVVERPESVVDKTISRKGNVTYHINFEGHEKVGPESELKRLDCPYINW